LGNWFSALHEKRRITQADKSPGVYFCQTWKKRDVYKNPRTGVDDRIPRHNDINEILAGVIIKNLS
jgi:hypothetical protein